MFTVVIAEKEHIDSISEYSTFLKPFINEKQVVFCEWKPGERSLAGAVPELAHSVSTKAEWRAIVIHEGSGLNKKNPFNIVEYTAPEREYTEEIEDEEAEETDRLEEIAEDPENDKPELIYPADLLQYLERVRQAKFEAFDKAAEQPLTRLMTYLCRQPTVTHGMNNAAEDPEFAEYVAEFRHKQQLRDGIINGEKLDITLPAEVICVARRTCTEQAYDIRTSWMRHTDSQYTRFFDWNMYFDKMRYFIFDLLPVNHRNYSFDYIRFLSAVLLVANNDLPDGAINPQRVYALDCENDNAVLDRLLSEYDAKLEATGKMLEEKITALKDKQPTRLTDREASAIFCSKINVPVTINSEFDKSGMFVKTKDVGLSTDCRTDEKTSWLDKYKEAGKTLVKYLKQPKRAIKKAASDMRALNKTESDKARLLNEFQLEDVIEHIHEEEMQMVNTETSNFYDISEYTKRMEAEDKEIKKKIDTRMSRKTTVILGVVTIFLFLIGFLPLIISNRADRATVILAVIIMMTAVALMAVVALICLFCLRGALVKLFHRFNRVMSGICGDVNSSLLKFSNYLSHACNVMRGFSVLNYRAENEDPDTMQMRIYQKHIYDIISAREELHEVFGKFITGDIASGKEIREYDYDFTRAIDFKYPLPQSTGEERTIEFVQSGSYAKVRVDFVKRLSVRREELYD